MPVLKKIVLSTIANQANALKLYVGRVTLVNGSATEVIEGYWSAEAVVVCQRTQFIGTPAPLAASFDPETGVLTVQSAVDIDESEVNYLLVDN